MKIRDLQRREDIVGYVFSDTGSALCNRCPVATYESKPWFISIAL